MKKKKIAEEEFSKINNAYKVLCSPFAEKMRQQNYSKKYGVDEEIVENLKNIYKMNKDMNNNKINENNTVIIKYKIDYDYLNDLLYKALDPFNRSLFPIFYNDNKFIRVNNNHKKINIRLFGQNFINNNLDNCYFELNGFKYKLNSNINIMNDLRSDDELEFEIKLIGINKITDMSYMFENCNHLSPLNDFSKWNTSNITNMSHMFSGCKYIPDISNFDISNVTNINKMFYDCFDIKSLPNISKWNVSNVKDMKSLFENCKSLLYIPDISKWNTNNVREMSCMFKLCKSLSIIPDISKWNISNLLDILKCFMDVSHWFFYQILLIKKIKI